VIKYNEEHRDKEAALRLLKKAIRRHGVSETIPMNGSEAHEATIKRYTASQLTLIFLRLVWSTAR
jgi:transposase-like protein